MKSESEGFRSDAAQVARGMMMGGADIVPGVSGGTMALILGIYERLVAAISHFDTRLLALLKLRDWRAAAAHIDLRFLIALGIGVGTGIVVLGSLMTSLLKTGGNIATTCPLTIAAFFGLIVASALHVGRMIKKWSIVITLLIVVGTLIGYTITGLPAGDPTAGPAYLFLCGMIAICAMILPGISGSFIMVLLGVYLTITGAINNLKTDVLSMSVRFDTLGDVQTLAIFACGCVVGILSFSKILRWLLEHFHGPTMAVLCGFMLGSLRKLWPFQAANTQFPAVVYQGEHSSLTEWLPTSLVSVLPKAWVPSDILIPSQLTGLVLGCFGTMIAAFAFVLVLEWVSSRTAK